MIRVIRCSSHAGNIWNEWPTRFRSSGESFKPRQVKFQIIGWCLVPISEHLSWQNLILKLKSGTFKFYPILLVHRCCIWLREWETFLAKAATFTLSRLHLAGEIDYTGIRLHTYCQVSDASSGSVRMLFLNKKAFQLDMSPKSCRPCVLQ